MGSRRRKKKSLAVTWVKGAAREVVGQPKPVHVHKGTAAPVRPLLPGDVANILDDIYKFQEQEEDVTEPVQNYFLSGKAKPYVPIAPTPHRAPHHQPGVQYSLEVVQHVNYLREAEGEEAVRRYLTQLKDSRTNPERSTSMSYNDETPAAGLQGLGTIGTALKEAQDKVKFFRKRIAEDQAEETRWVAVVEGLQQVLGAATGPARAVARVAGETSKARTGVRGLSAWKEPIIAAMNELSPTHHAVKLGDLVDKLAPNGNKQPAYGGVATMVRNGVLVKDGNKLYLAAWTEPASEQIGKEA